MISRGRTIRQFILYTLTIPVLFALAWITIMGGTGLIMEREAGDAGLCCSDPAMYIRNVSLVVPGYQLNNRSAKRVQPSLKISFNILSFKI